MKKCISIVLIVMLTLNFAACNKKKNDEYKIYYLGSEKSTVEIGGKTITYHTAEELELDVQRVVFEDNDQSLTSTYGETINIDGKATFVAYRYTESTVLSESKRKELRKFGVFYSMYHIDENDKIDVCYNVENGKLVYFSKFESEPPTGDFTVEQAKEKSALLIQDLYGKDALDGYVIKVAEIVEINKKDKVTVLYEKQVNGYPTSETILVRYNLAGELIALNAKSHGIFDVVKDGLSETKIKNAEKELLSSLPEDAGVQKERRILLDGASGVCYLEIVADGEVYYINII